MGGTGDALEQSRPEFGRQFFGIVETIKSSEFEENDGGSDDRTSERSAAGFIDAGFNGHITLELANVASLPITIYPGMKIGQISFMTMTTAAAHPYGKGATGSKYQGQRGPTPSRYFENFRPPG